VFDHTSTLSLIEWRFGLQPLAQRDAAAANLAQALDRELRPLLRHLPQGGEPDREPRFVPAAGTPTVNGLTPVLLQHNPNLANPFRFDRADLFRCDQLHEYSLEQKAFHGGAMDQFVWSGRARRTRVAAARR
jgi:hypothetical protein